MTTKAEQRRVAILEGQYAHLSKQAAELEDENYQLKAELEGLRGYVPPFPDEVYVTHPTEYIKQFNQLRHLKEIPQ